MKPGPARPGPVLEILENHAFPFCVCCPAGGLDIEKLCFLYLFNLLHVANLPDLLGYEPRKYARTLSFEKWCVKVSNGCLELEL